MKPMRDILSRPGRIKCLPPDPDVPDSRRLKCKRCKRFLDGGLGGAEYVWRNISTPLCLPCAGKEWSSE